MYKFIKNRTLTKDLTVWLVSMVALTIALLCLWYLISSGKSQEQEFTERTECVFRELSEVINYPLYNIDTPTIVNIVRSYEKSIPEIAGIRIQNEREENLYDSLPENTVAFVVKKTTLTRENILLGNLSIAFTRKPLLQKRSVAIFYAIAATIFVSSIIALAIHLFMGFVLKKPLDTLVTTIRQIANGDFNSQLATPPQKELETIINEVNKMAVRLSVQQEQLTQSEQKYRQIFDNAVDGIFVASLDGGLITVNTTMVDILGYDSEEELILASSTCISSLFTNQADLDVLLKKLLKEKCVTGYTTSLFRKDGRVIWCSFNIRLVKSEESGLAHLEGSMKDISEFHLLEKKLQQAQKMRAIGTLAGGIAHDFNNILTAIFGFTELALIQSKHNPEVVKNLERAIDASKRAKELVGQILTFSRKTDQNKMLVPLYFIVREAVKLLRSSIPATVSIEQDISTEASVFADASQLHQVVMNLATNGYQAMETNGGTLRISLFEHTFDQETIVHDTTLSAGDYLVLEVKDTGTGIKKELLEKIFEPYFTTKGMEKGTGLGLAVVHGIVGDCKGAVTIDSSEGVGTVFRVFLPKATIASSKNAAPARGLPEPPNVQGTEHLLIAEDEKMLRRLMYTYFSNCGYTVTLTATGKEALQLLQAQPDGYDILMTDLTMPGITGIELAKEARKIAPTMPVVLCTGYSAILDRKEAADIGIKDVIEKPISMLSLAQRLRKTLDLSKKT